MSPVGRPREVYGQLGRIAEGGHSEAIAIPDLHHVVARVGREQRQPVDISCARVRGGRPPCITSIDPIPNSRS